MNKAQEMLQRSEKAKARNREKAQQDAERTYQAVMFDIQSEADRGNTFIDIDVMDCDNIPFIHMDPYSDLADSIRDRFNKEGFVVDISESVLSISWGE